MVNSPKNCRTRAVVLAAALSLTPLWGNAAGLGRITVQSALGQPLRAELEVTAAGDEIGSLVAKVASTDAFKMAGIEYQPALASVRFSKDVKERNGRRYVEVTSDKPINEPYVDMLIELNWSSGRLVREYTFLLDPPAALKQTPSPVMSPDANTTERVPTSVPATGTVNRPANPLMSAAQTSGGATRRVVTGDTLGRIAAQTKPEGISLDQMLVALFRSNKEAFSGDNMNRLKAGKILSIPSADEASKVEKVEARREIVAQAADFNVYRSKLAALAQSAPAVQSNASQTSSGKISPKVTDSAPKPMAGDKLEVSKSEGGKGSNAKGQPLPGHSTLLEEDLVARDRALREANSRIADLEKNINDLKKLAELKSQAGAAAQQKAEAAKPSTALPAAEVAGLKPAVPTGGVSPAPSGDVVKESAKDLTKATATAPAPGAAPPASSKAKVAAPPPPEPESDLFSDTDLLTKAGILVALLLGAVGITMARRKRKAFVREDPVSQPGSSADSVFSNDSVADSNVSRAMPTDYSVSENRSAGTDEPLDPIVEADTFLAFGRDAQAEERLLEGLAANPGRHAIHVKLLEIYASRRSLLQFNTLAQDLHDQTGGTGTEWERVLVMGQNLDPKNPLYRAVSEAPVAEIDPQATMSSAAPVTTSATEATVAEPPPSGLDFDLGLDDDETAPAEIETSSALGIDFNVSSPTEETAQSGDPSPVDGHLANTASVVEVPEVAAPAASDASSIDFEFDLGTAKLDAPASPAMSPPPSLNLDGISLELDTPSREHAPVTASSSDRENPEAATKLELALAYEEMGDREGARELLDEVLKEGSALQQLAAKARLDQLA